MASMASAASGFVLTPNVATNTNSVTSRSNALFFSSKNNNSSNRWNSRLVVRAAEDSAATPAAATTEAPEAAAPKPKPPPIGPKRGTKVSIYAFDSQLSLLKIINTFPI